MVAQEVVAGKPLSEQALAAMRQDFQHQESRSQRGPVKQGDGVVQSAAEEHLDSGQHQRQSLEVG